MSVNTQHIISDTGIFLDEKTKTKTRAVSLLDTKIKDIYYEKYEENGKYHYSVHALVEYNKKDYDEEKARLANEYAQLKQKVVNRYTKAKQLIGDNNVFSVAAESLSFVDDTELEYIKNQIWTDRTHLFRRFRTASQNYQNKYKKKKNTFFHFNVTFTVSGVIFKTVTPGVLTLH